MSSTPTIIRYVTKWSQIALLTASLLLIFLPRMRYGASLHLFWGLIFVMCLFSNYERWKAGYLTKTPRQIYETARETGAPVISGLEKLALFAATAAIVVLNTSR